MASAMTNLPQRKAKSKMDRSDDEWGILLEKIAADQDMRAFEKIFKHFGPQIKSFARTSSIGKLGDNFPDDLVQEVMTSVWRKSHQYDRSKAKASTWIFTIARNQRIDMLRRTAKLKNEVLTEEIWDEPEIDGPIVDVQRRASERLIHGNLGALPPEQREVLGKVYMEEKSHQDVANELGIPLGTVKSRVRLALNKLKVLVEPAL